MEQSGTSPQRPHSTVKDNDRMFIEDERSDNPYTVSGSRSSDLVEESYDDDAEVRDAPVQQWDTLTRQELIQCRMGIALSHASFTKRERMIIEAFRRARRWLSISLRTALYGPSMTSSNDALLQKVRALERAYQQGWRASLELTDEIIPHIYKWLQLQAEKCKGMKRRLQLNFPDLFDTLLPEIDEAKRHWQVIHEAYRTNPRPNSDEYRRLALYTHKTPASIRQWFYRQRLSEKRIAQQRYEARPATARDELCGLVGMNPTMRNTEQLHQALTEYCKQLQNQRNAAVARSNTAIAKLNRVTGELTEEINRLKHQRDVAVTKLHQLTADLNVNSVL